MARDRVAQGRKEQQAGRDGRDRLPQECPSCGPVASITGTAGMRRGHRLATAEAVMDRARCGGMFRMKVIKWSVLPRRRPQSDPKVIPKVVQLLTQTWNSPPAPTKVAHHLHRFIRYSFLGFLRGCLRYSSEKYQRGPQRSRIGCMGGVLRYSAMIARRFLVQGVCSDIPEGSPQGLQGFLREFFRDSSHIPHQSFVCDSSEA